MKTILRTLLVFVCLNHYATAQNAVILSKEKTIALYNILYLSSEIDSISWNGNTGECLCGELDNDIYTKAQDRINFFRLVSGLNEVKNNPGLNEDAQNAALLIKANNQLTHYPKNTMKCFSQSAYNGCSKSCIGISDWKHYPGSAFITGFMRDYGASNYYVGHRKWLLYTKLTSFGYGATNTSEAVLTVDGVTYDPIKAPEFIAYPWHGYVPVNLIFPKWSFSISEDKNVDFSSVKIIMKDDSGEIIEIEKLKEYRNYLDHTIVWTATGLFSKYDIYYGKNHLKKKGYVDRKITVHIKNVIVDGKVRNYKYFVEPIEVKTLTDGG